MRAEVPPDETGQVPIVTVRAEPRWFGMTPPMAAFGLALAALAAAVALFATGHWPLGLILVGAAILCFAGFLEVARRQPDTELARASSQAFDGVRARTGSALEAWAARGRAQRESFRLRHELGALQGRRRELLTALGDAVYRGEEAAVDRTRGELEEVDRRVEATGQQIDALQAAARERIEKARLAVQQTQMVQIPEPYPPPGEGAPPIPERPPEQYPPPDEGTPPVPEPGPDPLPGPEPIPGPPPSR